MNLESTIYNIVKSAGVELYDIETVKSGERSVFRVYITSKDGISLDKCSEISNLLSPILDIENPLNNRYAFEVSSPGIERKLKKIEHFQQAIGERVKIKLNDKKEFKGFLNSIEDEKIVVDENEINLSDIKSAKTYFQW